MTKKVRIKFFATLRHLSGKNEIFIELPDDALVIDLKNRLIEEIPEIKDAVIGGIVSINHEFAFDDDVIPFDAEIAVFPQVSGGSRISFNEVCEITSDEINFLSIIDKIKSPETGAICTFTGVVRGRTENIETKETLYLRYEAYEEMALEKMHQIVQEIRNQWHDIQGVAMIQRIGKMEVGEQTVMISCSSAHRDSGIFEAAEYGINRLKEIVPVWKQEIGPDGEKWIEGHYKPGKND